MIEGIPKSFFIGNKFSNLEVRVLLYPEIPTILTETNACVQLHENSRGKSGGWGAKSLPVLSLLQVRPLDQGLPPDSTRRSKSHHSTPQSRYSRSNSLAGAHGGDQEEHRYSYSVLAAGWGSSCAWSKDDTHRELCSPHHRPVSISSCQMFWLLQYIAGALQWGIQGAEEGEATVPRGGSACTTQVRITRGFGLFSMSRSAHRRRHDPLLRQFILWWM